VVPLTDAGRAFKTEGGTPQSTPRKGKKEEDKLVSQAAEVMMAALP